ncbi:MAG: molybdate ABC transporter permease subunit [Cyanobacteria bacterium J06614_10]
MLDLSPLWISLRIAAIATAITGILGVAAARFMQHYRGRWRSLLEGFFLAPMVLPPTVLGFLLLLLLGKNGPFGSLLSFAGIDVIFTWYAAVIAATVVAFPLMYKTTSGAFEQIDSSLQQAARTLGASETSIFWRITLPLALPGLFAGITLAFARALGEFGATLMLAGNIPGRTQTLPMAIYFAVEGGDFREAALWSAVVLGISLLGLLLVNREFANRRLGRQRRNVVWKGVGSRQAGAKRQTHWGECGESHLMVDIYKQMPGFELAVSFVVGDGQPLGLLGASGAGKSLILRCIAGIETPDSGRIVLNGRVLFDSAAGINLPSCDRKVGILFQNYALFPHLTVAQNVAFGVGQQRSPKQVETAVAQQLAAVQLGPLAERYPHELSGGQQQRVALARALASQPEVLLLDEPFSALDTHLRSQIERQLTARLQSYRGITLLVTHNLEEAYRVCHQLLVIDGGRAIAHDTKHRIFEQPRTVRIAQLTGCKNLSPAVAIGPSQVAVHHWQCHLQTVEPLPSNLSQVGIRAHQITFVECDDIECNDHTASLSNVFHCWLASTSETPHRMTLYLKLHHPPAHKQDYHLQAEVFKEKWFQLKDRPFPWKVHLDPLRLLLLKAQHTLDNNTLPSQKQIPSGAGMPTKTGVAGA